MTDRSGINGIPGSRLAPLAQQPSPEVQAQVEHFDRASDDELGRCLFLTERSFDAGLLARLGLRACSTDDAGFADKIRLGDDAVLVGPQDLPADLTRRCRRVRVFVRLIAEIVGPLLFYQDVMEAGGVDDATRSALRTSLFATLTVAPGLRTLVERDARSLPAAPKPYPSLTADEVMVLPASDCVVEDVLPDGVSILYGDTQTLKSFCALDLAEHVTRAMAWRGQQVKAGPVYLFCGEGFGGQPSRLRAWQVGNPSAPPRRFELRLFPMVPRFGGPEVLPTSIECMRATLAAESVRPVLLIIDTLSNATAGSDETNGPLAMVIESVKALRIEFPGTSFLFLHHTRKAGGEGMDALRGGTVLRDNSDGVLRSDRIGDLHKLRVEKLKDGQEGRVWPSRLLVVPTGTMNRFGKLVTSCVLVKADADEARAGTLSPVDEAVLRVLTSASIEGATRAQIVKSLGKPDSTVWESLRRLSAPGDARVVARSDGGQRLRYWLKALGPSDEPSGHRPAPSGHQATPIDPQPSGPTVRGDPYGGVPDGPDGGGGAHRDKPSEHRPASVDDGMPEKPGGRRPRRQQ